MPTSFNHNKKRNSGLVYEFLVRRMGLTMIDSDPDAYMRSLSIIKKYYANGTPLSKEKEIFDVIRRNRGLSEQAARQSLKEIKDYVRSLDFKKIDIKKSNLIKEINMTFGKDFFDVHRIPEYRLLASIQMLVDQYKTASNTITESVQKIQLEESVVRFMMSSDSRKPESPRGEKVDSLVASLAMKKFEERYSESMNEDQKKVLRLFMNYSMTGNKQHFQREMEKDRDSVVKRLTESRNDIVFKEDKIMAKKMDEALSIAKSLKDMTADESVQEMLLFHKLLSEIESNE